MVKEDKNIRGHLAMSAAYIIFGLNMVVGKMAMASPYITPFGLTIYRMVGAAILFWAFSFFAKKEKVSWHDLLLLFVASLFGITINQTAFIHGLSLTSPVNASIIVTIGPLITMVGAALYLKEPITWKKTLGVILGATGAILLVLHSAQVGVNGSGNLHGDLFCALSSLSFSTYLIFFRDLIRRYSPVTIMKWLFFFAALCTLPFGYEHLAISKIAEYPSSLLWEISFVVVFATFISYLLLPIGQKTLRPTIVSMYNYIQPLVASIVAVALSMDTFGIWKTIAAVLIFLGVYIATTSKSRAQLQAQELKEIIK